MIKVIFLIRAMGIGGAERQLIEQVRGLDKTQFEITVATFYDGGNLLPELKSLPGVKVVSLAKKGRWDLPSFGLRLWKLVKQTQPDILYGFMDGPNLICLLLGKLAGTKVVWSLHSARATYAGENWLAQSLSRLNSWLSILPGLIIVNSECGLESHVKLGYRLDQMLTIPNGIDTDKFAPDAAARERIRQEFGIAHKQPLIGLVGRLNPVKDHSLFLRAAARLHQVQPEVRFICVGDGTAAYRAELETLSQQLGLTSSIIWAGPRHDMAAIYNGLDIITSTSISEGLPNVIAEGMACGVLPVVTNVGDSAKLVGKLLVTVGLVIPSGGVDYLVKAWQTLLSLPEAEHQRLSEAARQQILENYSLSKLVNQTASALVGVL
ncbi:MAG: glycosyltransferase [Chloroflexi bacterium]|nr:glycosyltransferase [Chloroflexota bacterium]